MLPLNIRRSLHIATAFVAWLPASLLLAATIQVNSNEDLIDQDPSDGSCDVDLASPGLQCTLRAAVMTAEANGEADLIRIPPGLEITLTLSGDGGTEIGDLNVSTEIEITGFDLAPPDDPLDLPRINAFFLGDRHFSVLNGDLTLRGLRLDGGTGDFAGGSLFILGNSVTRVEHTGFLANSANRGGAIHAAGAVQVIVEDSSFIRNQSGAAEGAAISVFSGASLTVRRSSFVDNRGDQGFSLAGSTIISNTTGRVEIENSTLDGTLLVPPIAGVEAATGIWFSTSGELLVRNTTISNFPRKAIQMTGMDGDERVIVANSVLSAGMHACTAEGDDLSASDIQIHYSLVESQLDCESFYGPGVRIGESPDLGNLTPDAPPRLTSSRPPTGALANVVDSGQPASADSNPPDFQCSSEDQRANPRAQDGNADGSARCDLGAIEEGPPQAFIVDYFEQDLLDSNPGDGQCTTIIIPGIGSVCTLRAAVMETNALPGLQRILFENSDQAIVLTQPSSPTAAGGDLNITESLAIEGNLSDGRPATFIENQVNDDRIFFTQVPGEAVYLRNLELSGGDTGLTVGGAVLHNQGLLFMRRLVLRDNFSGAGGGAVAILSGSILIEDSDIHSNETLGSGAALLATGGSIGLLNSSIRDHQVLLDDGSPSSSIVTFPGAGLVAVNTTISNNRRGIQAIEPNNLFIFQSTLFNNINGALDVEVGNSSDIEINSSILGGSLAPDNDCHFFNRDLAQRFVMQMVLDTDESCAFLSFGGLTADPRLEPLSRPDGQISFSQRPDRNLAAPSPAIDAGPEEFCLGQRDQYGQRRPQDIEGIENLFGPCDLGAVEVLSDRLFRDRFESLLP